MMAPREVNHADEQAVHAVIGGQWLNEGGNDAARAWDIVLDSGTTVDVKGLAYEGGRLGVKEHQLFNASGCDVFVLYDRFSGYMAWVARERLLELYEQGLYTKLKDPSKPGRYNFYFQRMDLNERMDELA